MDHHDVRRARLRWLGLSVGFLVAAILVATSLGAHSGGATLHADASVETTTTVDETTTTTAEVTTTTVAASTSTSSVTRGTGVPSVATSLVPTTLPATPLLLSQVRVSVGAPCHDESTTTTGGVIAPHEVDGCWFFVFWPAGETNVRVTIRSDRGFNQATISAPCQQYEGECHALVGPVFDRPLGSQECFWLTTADAGWATKSNDVCITWPQRL